MDRWVRTFVKWLRRLVGRAEPASVEIVESYHAPHVTVFRLIERGIPGCADFWKFERHRERITFWICVVNVADMRSDLGIMGISRSDFLRNNGRGVAADIAAQLQTQEVFFCSHYWICGFNIPTSGIDSKGRHYVSTRIADIKLLACDLQGIYGAMAGDKFVRFYASQVAYKLANDEFREFAQHSSWRVAVRSIDWIGMLEGMAQRSKLKIAADHKLQVRKSVRK